LQKDNTGQILKAMSRYRPNFNKLPSLEPDTEEDGNKSKTSERDFTYLYPRRGLRPVRVNLEGAAPSDFKTEITTNFGQFVYSSSMGASFKDYLQNLIVFLLGIDPECSEAMFARRIRNIIVDEKELNKFNYHHSHDWNLQEEPEENSESLESMQNAEDAIKFTSGLPDLKEYSVSLLFYSTSKVEKVSDALKKYAKLSDKALAQFLRAKTKRSLVLPSEDAKELYIALRTIGAILVIREPSTKKTNILSVSEKKNLQKPSSKISRIGLSEKKKKISLARLATIQDIKHLNNILK
jgi:hypothetical protein